jgi:hypothetical protein
MKINNRVFVSFAITLQILMLLFATAVIPAAADEEGTPSPMPLVLQGTVELDGEPAPVNTEITAKVNGVDVGTTKVDQEGVYGSQPGTKLYITCEPDNYGDIKFYVNGVESELLELLDVGILKNAIPGEVFVNMVAVSPDDDGTGDDGTGDDGTGDDGTGGSRSSGGGSYSETATTSSETATTSDPGTDDESSSGSTASASTTSLKSVATTQSTDDSAEEVPASETGSSMMVIVIGAIILLGIIVTVGYKLKKN